MSSLPQDPMAPPSMRSRIWPHFLIMLIAAPLLWGLIFGFLYGFSTPKSAGFAVTKFLEWTGSVFIALLIGWLTLFFRKPLISWALLLLTVGYFAYSVQYTEQKLGKTSSRESNSREHIASLEGPTSPNVLVSEAIEGLPGITETMITPEVILKIESLLIADLKSKIETRAEEIGEIAETGGLSATSIIFQQSGERAVITELHYPGSARPGSSFKVIWWAQDGQLKRVYCLDPSGANVNFRRGDCGRQVAKTFRYNHWFMGEK